MSDNILELEHFDNLDPLYLDDLVTESESSVSSCQTLRGYVI